MSKFEWRDCLQPVLAILGCVFDRYFWSWQENQKVETIFADGTTFPQAAEDTITLQCSCVYCLCSPTTKYLTWFCQTISILINHQTIYAEILIITSWWSSSPWRVSSRSSSWWQKSKVPWQCFTLALPVWERTLELLAPDTNNNVATIFAFIVNILYSHFSSIYKTHFIVYMASISLA